MKTFKDFIAEFVMPHETEYNKDRSVKVETDENDPGGTTKYGIDQRSHPDVNIAALTYVQAFDIYVAEYVDSKCVTMPYPVNLVFFDAQVNAGFKQAVILTQRALDVLADGKIGKETNTALSEAKRNPEGLCYRMIRERENFYNRLAHSNPRYSKYLLGWLNRCYDLREYVKVNS